MKPMVKRVVLFICCLFMGLTFSSCKKKVSCPMLWPFSVNASFKKTIYNLNEEDILFDIGIGIEEEMDNLLGKNGWFELRATTVDQSLDLRKFYNTSYSKVLLTIQPSEINQYPLKKIFNAESNKYEFSCIYKDTYSIPKDIFLEEERYFAISLVVVSYDEADPTLLHFPVESYGLFQYAIKDHQITFTDMDNMTIT